MKRKLTDAKKKALGIAIRLRLEFQERGEFKQNDYRDALADALIQFEEIIFSEFVDELAKFIDNQFLGYDPDSQDEEELRKRRAVIQRNQRLFDLVLPYWTDRNMTLGEVIALYLADHPEDEAKFR